MAGSGVQRARIVQPRPEQIRARFAEQGAEPGTMTQPQSAAFVDAEMDKWGKVIATANVKID